MNKIQEIILSYAAAINPTEDQKKIAEQRLLVCMGCEHWKENPERCGLCGCLTKGKVFSPRGTEACPEKRWHI